MTRSTEGNKGRLKDVRLRQATETLQRLSMKYSIDLPPDYYVRVARTFAAKGELGEAKKNLRRALEKDPTNSKAWWDLVSAYLDEHRYSKALQEVRRALSQLPNNPDLRILKGIALSELRRYPAALQEFDHPSVRRSKSSEIQWLRHRNRATTLSRQSKDKEVLSEVRKLYELDPEPETLGGIAEAYLSLDNDRAALRFARRAVAKDPSLAPAWVTIGIAESQRGRFKAAVTAFENSRMLDPLNPEFLSNLAHALDHTGDYPRAMRIARELRKLDPGRAEGFFWEARALWLTGSRKAARRVASEGVRRAKAKSSLKSLLRSMDRGRVVPSPGVHTNDE